MCISTTRKVGKPQLSSSLRVWPPRHQNLQHALCCRIGDDSVAEGVGQVLVFSEVKSVDESKKTQRWVSRDKIELEEGKAEVEQMLKDGTLEDTLCA